MRSSGCGRPRYGVFFGGTRVECMKRISQRPCSYCSTPDSSQLQHAGFEPGHGRFLSVLGDAALVSIGDPGELAGKVHVRFGDFPRIGRARVLSLLDEGQNAVGVEADAIVEEIEIGREIAPGGLPITGRHCRKHRLDCARDSRRSCAGQEADTAGPALPSSAAASAAETANRLDIMA
jgi:hypothetical protein